MNIVRIKNIRHINDLEFRLPGSGVHVLTGSNGSGKTSLLAAILRIGYFRAFQDNFKTSKHLQLDHHGAGYFEYEAKGRKVKYRHKGVRWVPSPRKNRQVLYDFGYPQAHFLHATGARMFIQDWEFDPSTVRGAAQWLKDDLNDLLETRKFDHLRYIQTGSTRGRGGGSQRWKKAYAIRINPGQTPAQHYSERNFSLGEMLLLNTLLLVREVPNNSILLIDELEMALHPRVQVALLRYLEKKATAKNLTVIISTHSSSLIRLAKSLIYLENDGSGNISAHYDVYPTYVLRNVAVEEDLRPDFAFFVEDEMAAALLKRMVEKYWQLHPNKKPAITKVLPIGGFGEVLRFTKNSKSYLLTDKIGQYAFLDEDVKANFDNLEAKGNSRSAEQQTQYELFKELRPLTTFLPITPELGVWNWFEQETIAAQQILNASLTDAPINLASMLAEVRGAIDPVPGKPRREAKRKMGRFITVMTEKTNRPHSTLVDLVMSAFVRHYYSGSAGEGKLKSLLNPIFKP